MLTPMSVASTGPDPPAAATGSRTSTAGRLLITLASSAAHTAMPSSAGSDVPFGSTWSTAETSPLSTTARTTTPSASTNSRNSGLAARTSPPVVTLRWLNARSPSSIAPASAAQAGFTPANDVPTNPASVAATAASVKTGTPTRFGGATPADGGPRSAANTQRKTAYSTKIAISHGNDISAVNRTNESPRAAKASRLVRLDTGSSSDAEFARWVHAYT